MQDIIASNSTLATENDGLMTYHLNTTVKKRDEENRIQVLTVGQANNKNIKSVLLLGETGTGKTRLVNSLVNHIFNVHFESPYRLELKDQLVGGERKQTHSQTDYITAYIIYNQHGMLYDYNYMIIDTPGFSDTRGPHHQQKSMERLRLFLMEDFDAGIDDLDCVGLVIKANENRELSIQQELLSNMVTLLGSDISSITQLIVTFASEDTTVDLVARSAGIQFAHMNCFDNWPLYIPHKISATFSQQKRENLKFRWQNMNDGCATFLETLRSAKPISLKRTRQLARERQVLDSTLKSLKVGVETADDLIKNVKQRMNQQQQYEEVASKIEWKRNVFRILKEKYKVMKGYHAHNCDICDKTCIFPCENPTKIPAAAAGTFAGAAAVGAAAGAVAGPPGAAIGAILGGAGIGAGTYVLTKVECKYGNTSVVCCEEGCMHELSKHSRCNERIVRSRVDDEVIDYKAKARYDELMVKIHDLKELIDLERVYLDDASQTLNANIELMIVSIKKAEALSLNSHLIDPVTVIDKMMLDSKDTSQIELYRMVRNAAKIMLNDIVWGSNDNNSNEGLGKIVHFNV